MCIVHRFRLDLQDSIGKDLLSGSKFYLKYPDDEGNRILVNEHFDIVGIIHWEWCRTVSKEDAFSSSCMMWPVAKFYEGSNELAEEELWLAEIFRENVHTDSVDCTAS
ncbi:hypothetical protein F4679DRAFT_547742 [Xylaria curta]|nr:hypothetical protein F4679DRAFT_547742 [Xylaria curta]